MERGSGFSTSFPRPSPHLDFSRKECANARSFVRVESDQRFRPSFLIKCLGSLRHVVCLATTPDKLRILDGFLLTTSLVTYIFKRSWAIPPLRKDPSRVGLPPITGIIGGFLISTEYCPIPQAMLRTGHRHQFSYPTLADGSWMMV